MRRLRRIGIAVTFVLALQLAALPALALDKSCSTNHEVWIRTNKISGSFRYHHWVTPGGNHHQHYKNSNGWLYSDTNLQNAYDIYYVADGTISGWLVYCVNQDIE